MPRHPTEHEGNVPLWLIPAVILQWIKKVGEDLEWVRIRRSARHYYQISVRIRSVKREFSKRAAAAIAGCGPAPESGPGPNVAGGTAAEPGPDPKGRTLARPAPGPEAGPS